MKSTAAGQGRILLCTFGSLGDLHPYLALGVELKRRGHAAVVATHPHYRAKIEAFGLEFHAVGPPAPEGPEYVAMMDRLMDERRGPEVVTAMFMNALRQTYDETLEAAQGSDLVVTHPLTFGAIAAAEILGISWVSSVLAPLSFLSAHDPPALPVMPGLARLRRLGPRFFRAVYGSAKRRVEGWVQPYHDLRRELGLPPVRDAMFEGSHSPRLVLAMFSRVMGEPQPDWPPRTVVTGICFHDDDGEDEQENRRLETFLESGEPPICFTLGSSAVWKAGAFYREAIDAAGRLGRRAVLLIGSDERNRPAQDLPAGVAAFRYAPYSRIFPRCAAVVHHGGVGTTGQALRAGRPMLVVPYGFDQFDNARCVERLGIGRWMRRGRLTAGRVARVLRKLLDPAVTRRAEEVGRRVADEDGPRSAADALDQVLTQPAITH